MKCKACGKEFNAIRAAVQKGQSQLCSQKCWGSVIAALNGERTYSRANGGKRADLNNRYFRSGWEANWARYLNWLQSRGEIVSWEYETETFEFAPIKRGARFYTPDFKVTNADGKSQFHEVKGWMDPRSATKLRRMKKYFPEIEVLVIDKPVYAAVAKKVAPLIKEWEWNAKKAF